MSPVELKAFLLNLNTALRLHVLGLSQRARDALPDMAYLIQGHSFSSSSIRDYLQGESGGDRKGLPSTHKFSFDPRVPLALFTGTRDSPHFRVYHADTLDAELDW